MKDTIGKEDVTRREEDKNQGLRIGDLVKYLSALARLQADSKTGNMELSDVLKKLAKGLRSHANRPVSQLPEIFVEGIMPQEVSRSFRVDKPVLPPNLDQLSHADVEELLLSPELGKVQLIELGVERFKISASRLARSNRESVIEIIRAAVDHEKSIGAISQEARRGGTTRSS